jgi:hypothetical protein
MKYVFMVCIIVGVIHGLQQINFVRSGRAVGVKPSNNLFTFLFMDKY